MSGHSKWAQIKRSKGAKDAKRGVLFSKLAKRITIAAKAGNSADTTLNYQLRTEIEKAKAEGMPNENIDRAAKKAFGANALHLTEGVYEAYGPFGTAFVIETASDNTNRVLGNIKKILAKHGGNLGSQGSVAWQFETKGQILIEKPNLDGAHLNINDIELTAIDAGAEDVRSSNEGLEVYTKPTNLNAIKIVLEKAGAKIAQAEIIKESSQGVDLTEEQKPKVDALLSELEEDEDIVAVHTSANIY